MERAAEWFALVTCVVIGLSHIAQPLAWSDAYRRLHRMGRPGAFVNGAISLATGAAFLATHPVWSGPAIVLTILACVLIVKGAICFLAPDIGLRSMSKAALGNGKCFRVGGVALLLLACVLGYSLATR